MMLAKANMKGVADRMSDNEALIGDLEPFKFACRRLRLVNLTPIGKTGPVYR